MIMPNMATMIAVITTDAPVEPAALHALLLSTVKQTFNKVTVDSDTSTNDTCIMLASGAAANAEPIVEGSDAFDELAFAVHEVCESLARNIAADGEGASKLVTVNVTGAANDEEADIAAVLLPTRRSSRPASPATTATGAALPWRSASAACSLTKKMCPST